jgi:hypothetical protein
VPSLIETRPFTINPALYAGPSFRLFSERGAWLYVLLWVATSFLLVLGIQMNIALAIVMAFVMVAIAIGLSFIRYKGFLSKPANQQIYRNCVVSLTEEELRQDYTDGSHTAMKLFAITSFRDVGDFYFVFATRQYGIVVPKMAFESIEDSKELAERLRIVVRKK